MLSSEQLLPNVLKRRNPRSVKLISNALSTLSQKSETVSQKWDCCRKVRLSPNSATVAFFVRQSYFCATVQSHFSAAVWTRLNVCRPSLDQQQSSKLVMERTPKQREQLRTLNASQTNNSMRGSMHASAFRAVFSPTQQVLTFAVDHAHQYVCVSMHVMELNFQFFFLSKFGNNCSEIRNIT